MSYEEFCAEPANKSQLPFNYTLRHETGGSAAIDLVALLTAQQRGARTCAFAYIDDEVDFRRAMHLLRAGLGDGEIGVGFDPATTTKETSNPSAVTITEKSGTHRAQKLVLCWKEKKAAVVIDRLRTIFATIAEREKGGRARRFCIAATNERYFADLTADALRELVPTELVIESESIRPAGYEEAVNVKTYLGDIYSAAVNDNVYDLPPGEYFKKDQRLTVKNAGRYECAPEGDGAHGDTFVSGGLAEYALISKGANYGGFVV
jgi:hypothetical protein